MVCFKVTHYLPTPYQSLMNTSPSRSESFFFMSIINNTLPTYLNVKMTKALCSNLWMTGAMCGFTPNSKQQATMDTNKLAANRVVGGKNSSIPVSNNRRSSSWMSQYSAPGLYVSYKKPYFSITLGVRRILRLRASTKARASGRPKVKPIKNNITNGANNLCPPSKHSNE